MKHTLEPIDDEKFLVNGVLVNLALIKQYADSRQWPGHSPHQAVAFLTGSAIMLHHGMEVRDSLIFHYLAGLYGHGFPIDEKIFSVVPGEYPYAKVWDGFLDRYVILKWIPLNQSFYARTKREHFILGVAEDAE